MDSLFDENFITTKQASEFSGYTPDYLARLARSKKILGKRIGHSWLIEKESIERFITHQDDHKISHARALARARETEYRAHRSAVRRLTRALTKPFSIPQESVTVVGTDAGSPHTNLVGVRASRLRSQALALSVSLLVVVAGALGARAEALPRLAHTVAEFVGEAAIGFSATFGDIPSRIVARIEKTGDDTRSSHPRVAENISRMSAGIASPALANFNFNSLRMALSENHSEPRMPFSKPISSFSVAPITFEHLQTFALDAYRLFTSPSRIALALTPTRLVSGPALASRFVNRFNLAFGTAVIAAAHSAIRADVALAYGLADAAPASARAAAVILGKTGNSAVNGAMRVPTMATNLFLRATEAPAIIAPAIASRVFGAEYAISVRFIKDTQAISEGYLAIVESAGRLAHAGAASSFAFVDTVSMKVRPSQLSTAVQDAYLGALAKGALAVETAMRVPKVATALSFAHTTALPLLAAAQPALSVGERVALVVYETVNGFMRSTRDALASLLAPPPTIVLPTPNFKRAPTAVQPAVNSYQTYTTIVQGVSQDSVARSLAAMRTDVLTAAAALIRPVAAQTATNATTIQQVNMIQDLSNLIVRNGDFRGGVFDNGTRVSATTGTFTNLNGGSLSVSGTATSTVAGNLSVAGNINFNGVLLQNNAPFTSSQWTTAGSNIYYSSGSVGIGTSTPGSLLSIGGTGTGWNFFDNATTTSYAKGIDLKNGGCFALNGVCVGSGSGSGTVGSGTTGQLPYYAANGTTLTATSSLFLATSGNVGIGVASTTALRGKLDVEGAISGGSDSRLLTLANLSSPAALPYSLYIAGGAGDLVLASNDTSTGSTINSSYPSWQLGLNGESDSFTVNRAPAGASISATNLFKITNTGSVGIGTTSPYRTLSVAGSGVFTGGDLLASTFTATSSITAASLSLTTALPVSSGGTGQASFTSSQLLYGNGTTALSSVATTTPSLGTGLSYSGTLGALVGGASGSLTVATSSLYSGTTGQLPYFSGTNTLTATSSIFLATSGNVGIGTTSPATKFSVGGVAGDTTGHGYFTGGLGVGVINTVAGTLQTSGAATFGGTLTVNGLCMTGDARLLARRRRRRRRADGSIEDYFAEPELIRIDSIRAGDLVLSLNERIGKMEWKSVLELYDMGEKPVYKLVTESGKQIRTTGNHPYLTKRGWTRVADLSLGDLIAAPKKEALAAMTRICARPSLDLGYQNFVSTPIENNSVVTDAITVFLAVATFKFIRKVQRFFLRKIELDFFNNTFLDTNLQLAHISPSMLGECVIHHSPRDFSTVLEETRPERRDASTSFQNFGLEYSMLSSRSSRDATKRSATTAGARRDSLPDLCANVFVAIGKNITKIVRAMSNNDEDIAFERIISIEYDGVEQVWDISVADTHNFIAEGLLAHNTYIGGNLTVASAATIGSLSGLVAGNAGALYAVASSSLFGFTPTPFAWTPQAWGNATSTTLGFLNGFLSTASSTFTASTNFPSGIWNSSGNVGIGTTSPGSLLSIGGTGTGWNFFDNATTTSYAKGIDLKNGGCFAVNGMCVGSGSGSGTVGSGTIGQFPYYAANGTTLTATSSLFLDTSGNIGIGTTSPWGLLSVNPTSAIGANPQFVVGSSTKTSFVITNAGYVGIGTSSPLGPLHVYTERSISLPSGATGGTITRNTVYTYHKFTSSGTFTTNGPGNVDVLVVAGGASGGTGSGSVGCNNFGAGGGGGGTNDGTSIAVTAQAYTITVGNGGSAVSTDNTAGNAGNNSTALGLTALGGGANPSSTGGTSGNGFVGAAGGEYSCGGGGGAGAAAPAKPGGNTKGDGGAGKLFSFFASFGDNGYFGGGGQGAGNYGASTNALGGGGSANSGNATANTGGGGGGAYGGGTTSGAGGSGIVIIRYATPAVDSLVVNSSSGNVGIGTTTPGTALDIVGALCVDDSSPTCGNAIRADGTIYAVSTGLTGIDVAELYPTKDATIEAGDLVMLDAAYPVFVSKALAAQHTLIGAVSTQPGVELGGYGIERFPGEKKIPVTLTGRVPVRVSTEGGPIAIGDRITSSSLPGVGMKAIESGMTVGIALESFDENSEGEWIDVGAAKVKKGKILVFVNLGYAKLDEPISQLATGNDLIGVKSMTNVASISGADALQRLSQLRGVEFNWDETNPATEHLGRGIRHVGVIAQEVEAVFPSLIYTDMQGYKMVDYQKLVGPLISAVNELNAKFLVPESATTMLPTEVLTAGGEGIDLYKLATYNLSAGQALAERVGAVEMRLVSLEDRVAMLESGAVSSASGSPLALSSSIIASALEDLDVLIQKGIAQFKTLVFSRLVASSDADGASSAGSVGISAGNTVAQVANSLVLPTTKIFVTFNSRLIGGWWVSDKAVGSFRVVLSEAQTADVSFDYFLVQTELQAPDPEIQTTDGSAGGATTTTTSATDTTTASSTDSGATAPTATSGGDVTPPVVTLAGDAALQIIVGDAFTDPGATASDGVDGDLTASIVVTGAVDTALAGLYELTYSATDAAGNTGSASRVVTVVAPPSAPADTPPDTGAAEVTP